MRSKKTIKNGIESFTVFLLIRLFRGISRHNGILISRWLAMAAYAIFRKHRRNAIRNLSTAFGNEKTEKEIHGIACGVFVHFATVLVDVIRIPLYLKEGLDHSIKVENLHYLEEAVNQGKGVVLLTGHFGNWELMGAWLAAHQYPVAAIAKPLSNSRLNRMLVDLRNQAGYINIARGNALAEIAKILKGGGILGVLMDQDTRLKGVFVNFFNRKTNTPIGPLCIARRYGALVVPAFMHLEKGLTYRLECFKPLCLSFTGDKHQDVIADARNCNAVYEQVIRRHPEQWAWMHRRWRRRPRANPNGVE